MFNVSDREFPVFSVAWRFMSTPIRRLNQKGEITVFEDIFFAAFRALLDNSSLAIFRAIFKPTSALYHELCKQTGRKSRSLSVDGVIAHWIGEEDADVVVLYFHGRYFHDESYSSTGVLKIKQAF